MDVILDELTTSEFFAHGGVVKMKISDEISSVCEVKQKMVFFDYTTYTRFIKGMYMTYLHKNRGIGLYDVYRIVNDGIELSAYIGRSIYTVDMGMTTELESVVFFYTGDKMDTSERKDPYGIPNVCFSSVGMNIDEYTIQRVQRGYDDSELWNLDGTIAKFIYPRLKTFAELYSVKNPDGPLSRSVLDRMVDGFWLMSCDDEKTEEENARINDALELFYTYFRNLNF